MDRHRARFFDLYLDEVTEHEALFHTLSRRRGDGFLGYDAGHAERSVNDEVLHHFKNVAEVLKQGLEKGAFDQSSSDARTSTGTTSRPSFTLTSSRSCWAASPQMWASITEEQVREQGERMLKESLTQHRQ